jgi:hypothetical protein
MPLNCPSKHTRFDVRTNSSHVQMIDLVTHPLNVLLDDRAFVELCGDVVGCRTNKLYPFLVGLPVGLSPLKAREK